MTYLTKKKWNEALLKYNKALRYASSEEHPSPDEEKKMTDVRIPLLLNSAATYLKLKLNDRAIKDCQEVIKLNSTNDQKSKAYYRMGEAHRISNDLGAAKENYTYASELQPDNQEIKNKLKEIKTQLLEQMKKEGEKYKKMFS